MIIKCFIEQLLSGAPLVNLFKAVRKFKSEDLIPVLCENSLTVTPSFVMRIPLWIRILKIIKLENFLDHLNLIVVALFW